MKKTVILNILVDHTRGCGQGRNGAWEAPALIVDLYPAGRGTARC